MKKNTLSANRDYQKNGKRELNSAGKMRFVYVFMLVLTIFSLFLRVSGTGRGRAQGTSVGTASRVLVFHSKDGSVCEDLVITATGSAVFSDCGNGREKQYALNSSERAQLQNWIDQYSPVNYDHNDPAQAGRSTTQLYLNGRGKQQPGNAEIQQLTKFATNLATKIDSNP
jgi:hypothetical protein